MCLFIRSTILVEQGEESASLVCGDSVVRLFFELEESILDGSLFTQHSQSSLQELSVVVDVTIEDIVASHEQSRGQNVACDSV